MRGSLRLVVLLAVLGAGYVALFQPQRLPFAVPWEAVSVEELRDRVVGLGNPGAGETTPPTGESGSTTIQSDPFGRVTDAALQAAVARQPISLAALRARTYPGSALTVVRTLAAGSNYTRQVVSYQSDGLTIYALLTVPRGTPPAGGWPAIVFNHGYIPPAEYRTTERYVAYQDAFARAGYVTLKSDYRGHGSSQGTARGGYDDPGYTIDVLNAAASVKKDSRVNARRLGMWGHSMGGQLTLRAMLVDPDIRAASLWAGVVASYDVLATDWRAEGAEARPALDSLNRRYLRALSPNAALKELRGRPIQLHHGTADKDVPYSFQKNLADDLRAAGQPVEAYRYVGDNHNLSENLRTALSRSVAFFRANL
ncbi:prolyl oligopeptidase family serine peptidase [uncultured Deinococcus sp.]|uniref:alpha/beta hydrolase family protein n=1 Tax=uncultured Deinococcus sp. TaxID=158789 RepID=UPI0025F7370C|nr:prolyl oligopeptidase family serine peptidase [uncultured Deinococcus sp.]